MNIYKDPYQQFEKLHEQEARGTEAIEVELVNYPANPYLDLFLAQQASWRPWETNPKSIDSKKIRKLIEDMVNGKIWMGQAFEGISFSFAIKNISRACTHQLVRTRLAGFMQESGREGTWDKAMFVTPLTILENSKIHAMYVNDMEWQLKDYRLFQENGIPPQDTRMVVGHGILQNIWATYNFRSLLETASKRLCCNMGWEINTLFRMMRDAIVEKFPHLGILLKSHCERSGGHKEKDNTNYYAPGASNNGNKVYFPLEGLMCGKASNLSEGKIEELLLGEKIA